MFTEALTVHSNVNVVTVCTEHHVANDLDLQAWHVTSTTSGDAGKKLSIGCRYVKLCHTREELGRLPQGPKLVLATLPSLQAGMARDLFLEWAADPKNLILFTQQAEVCRAHLVLMFCSRLLLIPAMACAMLCTFRSGQAITASQDPLHSIIRCIWALLAAAFSWVETWRYKLISVAVHAQHQMLAQQSLLNAVISFAVAL